MAVGAPANPMQFPAQPSSAMAGGIIEIVLVIAADVELGSERQPVRARGCGRHVEPGFLTGGMDIHLSAILGV